MTDWQRWHDDYANPESDLSRRLVVVQDAIRSHLDTAPAGPVTVLSMCAGRGDDLLGVLADHPRRNDVRGVLVELDPHLVAAARARAAGSEMTVRESDAGSTTAYVDAVPADLLLVCGVFGNVPDADVQRTVEALPTLCSPGATVIWTRHRRDPDLTPSIRGWFADSGFQEASFTSPGAGRFAVGVHRLTARPRPYERDLRLFSFDR